MRRLAAVAIFSSILTGCATTPQVDPETRAIALNPLICSNKEECEVYWQRAQVWVSTNSGYRIQTVSDAIIQTYGPMDAKVELAFQVTKTPRGDGSAQIMIRAACANIFVCRPDTTSAIAAFKTYVRGR